MLAERRARLGRCWGSHFCYQCWRELAAAAVEPVAGLVGVVGFVIAAAVIHHRFFGTHAAVYRAEYKRRIIGGMAKVLEPSMAYHPERGLPESWFHSSGLYAGDVDRYHVGGPVRGPDRIDEPVVLGGARGGQADPDRLEGPAVAPTT